MNDFAEAFYFFQSVKYFAEIEVFAQAKTIYRKNFNYFAEDKLFVLLLTFKATIKKTKCPII